MKTQAVALRASIGCHAPPVGELAHSTPLLALRARTRGGAGDACARAARARTGRAGGAGR
eukprot:2322318-Alexandrium_andersonii.AAC.1